MRARAPNDGCDGEATVNRYELARSKPKQTLRNKLQKLDFFLASRAIVLYHLFLLSAKAEKRTRAWRNWQTRTVQVRMGQPHEGSSPFARTT